jgi:hypothetical protein
MPDTIADLAARHGFSIEAVRVIAEALRHGGGHMAQFNHPELGGMGQWAGDGMIMIGDMFNIALKTRVDALCRDLAAHPGPVAASPGLEPASDGRWWPTGLGTPSARGDQNGMRYAFFADQHRLAIQQDGHVRIYDTGPHRITGFAQQQGAALRFSTPDGPVSLDVFRKA